MLGFRVVRECDDYAVVYVSRKSDGMMCMLREVVDLVMKYV